MSSSRRGKLIVVSGPSGTGKTSICRALLEQLPDTVWSVSATTRPKRPSDRDGTSYEFVTPEEFERRKQAGAFLETAEYVGNQYGTPRAPVEQALREGKNIVMELDVQGGVQVKERMPDAVMIFVMPPNRESLRARLEGRDGDAAQQLAKRLAEADGEIAVARDSGCYDHFVVNDVLETTIEQVLEIVKQERSNV